MEARGLRDILVVHSGSAEGAPLVTQTAVTLGNTPAVRWWRGSLAALPAYQVHDALASGLQLQCAPAARSWLWPLASRACMQR